MTNQTISGEAIVKNRQRRTHLILVGSLILGISLGYISGEGNYHNIPLWVIIAITAFILSLTVYYYALADEYQRMTDYKNMTYGVLLALAVMIPWYFAGIKGILPMPHVMMTFFLIIIPSSVMTIVRWVQSKM